MIMDNSYSIREISKYDFKNYYRCAFLESDPEAMYYTGSVNNYTLEQIEAYVNNIVVDPTRLDYLILNNDEIIGEIVLSDIKDKTCHFRICIYKKENFSKGIGKRFIKEVFNTAFNKLGIEEIELEVFPFNNRAISLYKKLGFKEIENIIDDEAQAPYREIIVMKLLKDHYINYN